jgi:hypothetical protein
MKNGEDAMREGIMKILNSLVKPKYPEIDHFEIEELDIWGYEDESVRIPEELHLDLKIYVNGTDYNQEMEIDDSIGSALQYLGLRSHQIHRNYETI